MTTLHMQSESVRDTARTLEYRAGELHYILSDLKSACARLSWAWQGSNATRFRSDFNAWMRRLDEQIHVLGQLAVRVNREAEQWEFEDRDDKFAMNVLGLAHFLPGMIAMPLWYRPDWKLLPPWLFRPPFWNWPPRLILPWPRFPWPSPFPPHFPWPVTPWLPVVPPWIDWWPVRPWPIPGWPWFPPIDWWRPKPPPFVWPDAQPLISILPVIPVIPAVISNFFPSKTGGEAAPAPVQQSAPAVPAPAAPPATQPVHLSIDEQIAEWEQNKWHIHQVTTELAAEKAAGVTDGAGDSANCLPASVIMAMRKLGIGGEWSDPGQNATLVDRARDIMGPESRDGFGPDGSRSESEVSKPMLYIDLENNASTLGLTVEPVSTSTNSIAEAIQSGKQVVLIGTFEDKKPSPWLTDTGTPTPDLKGNHVVLVSGYDPQTQTFIVNDPLRKTPVAVDGATIDSFVKNSDNPGARALSKL